ncbi:hypothetical protein LB559_13380 [Mesorhizobium sp. BR1-1-3]|uniref:hypothetical protein n=1 Tax=Mesorhizobium sp. BR1-1-3 TaxID=2876651 RepID=UPI001CD1201C|nr:hypothetical protein [Mesorhizobium sp. BR1-1-3]MBZ9888935.1 hypothetical protein [Mesorhizobium sp. BR1-1-3]
MSSEDEAMLSIKVDKRPISQAQLIGFVVILMGQAFVGGGLYYKFTSDIANAASKADLATLSVKVDSEAAARSARSAQSDRNFDDIQKQLKPLDTVSLRLDQNDKRDDAQDARIDRMLELIGAKLDTLTQNVADVKADVRVVAQDVKNLSGKTQPTSFRP